MKKNKELFYDFGAALLAAVIIELMLILPVHSTLYMLRHPASSAEAAAEVWAGLKLFSAARVCILLGGGLFLLRMFRDRRGTLEWLFEYRWRIGFGIIFGATLLKLNGSSIGFITSALEGTQGNALLFGEIRPIRGDEFIAFTEMALAQAHSGFKWFSDIWGYSPSDMFIVYGQPVCNPVTLFRPFSAGYLILGAEYGLAFYWSSRFVFLFLVSFEFGRMFTEDRRELSALYAVLVLLSPLVQWWYSVNELVEIIIFGQAAILLAHRYLYTGRVSLKILQMAGLVICAGGFVMSLYPPWMIPFFYVFAACFVCMLWENRKNIRLKKADALIWGCGILILGLSMLYIFSVSGDTIFAQMNTVYPGKRFYIGGPIDYILKLFSGWTSWLWTLFDVANACEDVGFISFFPLGIVLALLNMREERCADCWFIACGAAALLLTVYMCFPLPQIIGKITLLRLATARAADAIGFANLIILFRALALQKKEKNRSLLGLLLGAVIAGLAINNAEQHAIPFGMRVLVLLVCIAGTEIILHFSVNRLKKELAVLVLGLSVIGGLAVNPVNSGLGMIYDTAIVKEIEQITREDSGSWFVNGSFAVANLPTIVGAKSVNALATYPDAQLWLKLGLEDKSDIWNRYAHFDGHIASENDVELLFPDHIELRVTEEALRELDVKYILSQGPIEGEAFTELFERNGWRIYEIT